MRTTANFLKLLHRTIQSSLAAGLDDIWDNGAKQVQQGWMHIHGEKTHCPICKVLYASLYLRVLDQRNVPALGRIGDPDDIIASVLVTDSMVNLFLCYGITLLNLFSRLNPKHINPCHPTGSARPTVSSSSRLVSQKSFTGPSSIKQKKKHLHRRS